MLDAYQAHLALAISGTDNDLLVLALSAGKALDTPHHFACGLIGERAGLNLPPTLDRQVCLPHGSRKPRQRLCHCPRRTGQARVPTALASRQPGCRTGSSGAPSRPCVSQRNSAESLIEASAVLLPYAAAAPANSAC